MELLKHGDQEQESSFQPTSAERSALNQLHFNDLLLIAKEFVEIIEISARYAPTSQLFLNKLPSLICMRTLFTQTTDFTVNCISTSLGQRGCTSYCH